MSKVSTPHVHFVGSQRNRDTIVFVHGILFGHYRESWGRFSKLLPGDPDLPRFDLMLWGYDTGLWKGRSIELNGERLVTEMRLRIASPENAIVLVGHSLGGLVILRALCAQMERDLAQKPPCLQITRIILFGTPLNGHWVGRIARKFFPLGWLLNHQVRDLCRDESCAPLVANVQQRMCTCSVDGKGARKIPIRLNIGNRDKVVTVADRSAAKALFTDPPPNEYDGTHSNLKDPASRVDHRYLVLKNDLQETAARSFHRLSSELSAASDSLDKASIRSEIDEKFGHMVRSRIRAYPVKGDRQHFFRQALEFATRNALRRNQPPFLHIEHAVRALLKVGPR